jgi:shikimate kinase
LEDVTHSSNIVVLGEMGVGKTTIGRLLARTLGWPLFDSDEMIEADTGMTAAEIAIRDGISALHDRELDVFVTMSHESAPAVLAPAASVVDRRRGRDLLRLYTTVWLVASDDVLEKRQRRGDHRRAIGVEERAVLRERRDPYLEEIADMRVDTGTAGPEEVVRRVMSAIGNLS